ncbi:MAG: YdcF family protein [Acidobacteriaceae bacterium]|nr:YdcF family protein [Acidobacteriaceae bacterium]
MLSPDLNKTLPLVCLPVALSLVLLLLALLRNRSALIAVTLLNLVLFSSPAVADYFMSSLEDRYPYRPVADCPQSDAVFVFGGMLGPRDRTDGSIAWNEAAERFDRAVQIVKAGKARVLVLSGGAERYPGGGNEGELLKHEAQARGLTQEKIVVTQTTMDTEHEARELCRLVAAQHWRRVLVVTSAFHMPRAMRLSERCSADLIPVPVAYQTPDRRTRWAYKRLEYYIPQAEGLSVSERALREYLGISFRSIFR